MTDTVTVAQTGAVREIGFTEGMTVQEALTAAEFSISSDLEVRLNGSACADLETALQANDTILIVGSIRGA